MCCIVCSSGVFVSPAQPGGPCFPQQGLCEGGTTLMGCGTVTEVCLVQETGWKETIPARLPPAAQARCST